MRIVILGYSGLIGKCILECLVKNKSLYLFCVGRNIKFKPFKNSRIKYIKWDFNSFNKSEMLFLNQAHVVINCVGKTAADQLSVQKININIIKKLLNYINEYDYKIRFINLSSISVYGGNKLSIGVPKLISEKSITKITDFYSKSKLTGDLLIKNNIKKNLRNNFSYTILRISNVFGGGKKSNLFKYVKLSLKYRFWIRSSKHVMFNFINVKDVARAVELIISNLKVSRNKTYILSDDCGQYLIYKNYQNFFKRKIKIIRIPINIIRFLIHFIPLPKKIFNFLIIISSRTNYSNRKIKKELKFQPKYSITKSIGFLNE